MSKIFYTFFLILVFFVALGLYFYGKRSLADVNTPAISNYVEKTETLGSFNWQDFQPQSNKFHIQFPTEPQRAKDKTFDEKTKESKHHEMFISENNDKIFMLSVISYPNLKTLDYSDELIKQVIQDMVASNAANKLGSATPSAYQGLKAENFEINNPDYKILGKVIVNNNHLYVLSALAKNNVNIEKEANYFFESFQLNK